MVDNDIDISWPLENGTKMIVTRQAGDVYIIRDMISGRELTLSWKQGIGSECARLLFNGEDIETEEFMGYVGLMDDVTEELGEDGVGTVSMENRW